MYKRGPKTVCTPPVSEWGDLIAGNQKALAKSLHPLSTLRSRFRAELHEAAVTFEAELSAVAKSVGIPWQTPKLNDRPSGVVMAGHQPVIYHCGLAEKTKLLAAAVSGTNLRGYNIIIDTDAGDAGEMVFPTQAGILQKLSISRGGELFRDQSFIGSSEITAAFERISAELSAQAQPAAAKQAQETGAFYARLAGTKALVGNSLLRRLWEGSQGYLEVPLSTISALPAAREFIAAIISDGAEFHRTYNLALDTHRAEHRIKNAANPFPNLRADGQRQELPLWQLQTHQAGRIPYFLSSDSSESSAQESLLPRGALITTMLRFLGADLFIHGLGGATYEPVTDRLLAEYFALPDTVFVTVSANRYLFTQEITAYEEALACAETLKNIPTRIPLFLNQGLFTASEEDALTNFHARRETLVVALKAGKDSHSDVRQIGAELKALDTEIKSMLAVSSLGRRAIGATLSPSQLSQWYCRSFPYFFFAPESP
jgi:hypothetical protein